MPYCDGTIHQGSLEEPLIFKDTPLYFRGYNNTIKSFEYIISHPSFTKIKRILLTGSSAGGLGSFAYSNTLRDMLKINFS